ncbi:MAG: hypothetical protein ACJAZI_000887 [Cycloclasticus sp.]
MFNTEKINTMRKNIFLISLMFISFGLSASPGQFHYVKVLQAEIKESASDTSRTKFVVAIGRKLVEFGRQDGYILVGIDRTGGKDGWIKGGLVAPTDPDGVAY